MAVLAVALLGAAGPVAAVTFLQDFNSVRLPAVTDQVNPYPGWTIRVDGQVWYDVRFASEGPDSSACLVLRASTVDQGLTDAAVRLRFDLSLDDPAYLFLVDPEAVFQWDWWFRDNRLSEAVGLRVIYRRGGVLETREHWNTPFYTPNAGFDPVLVWDCHRLDLSDLATGCDGPEAECVELVALEFELRGPVNQELRLDNLYLGPRQGVADCGEVRRPGFVVQKLQSYSATMTDLDHDGRWDVLLPGFLGRPAQLWLGRDPQFIDRAADFGLDRYLGDVAVFLDLDNDGDEDLVTARVEHDGVAVLENLGHGRFAAEPRVYPTRGMPLSISALAAADVDGDGALDLALAVRDQVDVLMLGDGRGGFRQAPPGLSVLQEEVRASNGVLFADLDDDGDQDQVVAGVGILRNDGAGRLDLADPLLTESRGPLVEGATVEDFDGDGFLDIYLGVDQDSCRRPLSGRNLLFWGSAGGLFARDRRSNSVVADPGHCEGVAAADFDHDGHLDLFIGNRSGPSLCVVGLGGGIFEADRGRVFGTLEVTDLYGLCAVDRDDDGDEDVLILRKHNDPVLLENTRDDARFLKVKLLGVRGNWDAIGARARLYRRDGDAWRFVARRDLRAGEGYQLSGPRELHFGLPEAGPYRLEVTFPSGLIIDRDPVWPGQRVVVVESTSGAAAAWQVWRRVTLPRWSTRLAVWPMPLQHLVIAALAGLAVLVWWPLVRTEPRRRLVGLWPVGAAALVALGVAIRHHIAWQGTESWALAFSLPVGVAAGASLPLVVRYLRRPRSPVTIWDRLNEEFISYTHTGWCKNLETLIRQGTMLAGDLPAADRDLLHGRWREACEQFDGGVAEKLRTIGELGLSLEETRPVARDLVAGLRRLQHARRGRPEEIAAGARDLRQTVDRIAAIVEARLSCRADLAARTAFRAVKPDLDAAGIEGHLDTDAAAGVAVRIREHELVMVLQDLLRNAAEAVAGRPGARIVLRAEADIRRVLLVLEDNGPGLAGGDPDQLCQAGYTTKPSGSGYGLFHARKTLGTYRGVLTLADRPDGGLAVTVALQRPLHARADQQRNS
ncbi:MAG: FG-GAP-like repeat-containing protein [Candidatus Krumholzibacteriia bacterium]